ncbi:NAD-dependent epimerase/dehydratase family protein [Desulfovibrio inopinatus]|uniref:NAD-dependent epimerase/dehydratase family protein n=1 Tax=Desulfovibrio inopinatus TaxID=102109 RepID=UPI00040F01FC|nr:NAD(P)H-binding protein [Desulfovibrio inopinatus]
MRIFLTGASGGLGQCLLPRLVAAGHHIVVLVRNPEVFHSRERVVVVAGDICKPETYAHALYDIDVILHLAALTHSSKLQDYTAVNDQATADLIRQAQNTNFSGRFVYVSTRAAHPECGGYGASKAAAEKHVRESGFDFTILRPAEVYGTAKPEAVSKLAHAAASGFCVMLPGAGHYTLAPVYAENVHDALLASLESPAASQQTYDLAGPDVLTCREFVKRIMEAKNRKRPIFPIPLILLAWAARLFALIGMKHPPLTADQIPRLTCQKSADIEPAGRDLNYYPIDIETALSQGLL